MTEFPDTENQIDLFITALCDLIDATNNFAEHKDEEEFTTRKEFCRRRMVDAVTKLMLPFEADPPRKEPPEKI